MLRPAKKVVKTGTKVVGRSVSEVVLALTTVPGGDTVHLRRTGFGVSMMLDPRGSTLLDVLGADRDQRAETICRFLNRCSDEEMCEILAAFQEAAVRRAARDRNGHPRRET